jgi:hypothetical protein
MERGLGGEVIIPPPKKIFAPSARGKGQEQKNQGSEIRKDQKTKD